MYQPERTHIKKATGKNRQPRQPLGVISDNVVQLQETRQVQTRKLQDPLDITETQNYLFPVDSGSSAANPDIINEEISQLTLPKKKLTSSAMKRSFEAEDENSLIEETMAEDDDLSDDASDDLDLEDQEEALSAEAALADKYHFDTFPILGVSTDEITEFISTTLWCPVEKNNDLIAESTEMLETDLVKKVISQVQERIPAGYELFSLFARLAHDQSYVKPHQDEPHFAWRFIFRFTTSSTQPTTVGFHSSPSGQQIHTKEIPIDHGYYASRMVLSKRGVGLWHSVTPAIGSKDLQTSLIFDIRKTAPNVDSTVFNFLNENEIPPDCETVEVGGRNVYVDPARRISANASARGKIGGPIGGKMGDKAKKAAGGRKGDKAKKAAGGRKGDKAKKAAGGKSQNNRAHKEGIWYAARCDSLDCVEKTVDGKGKLSQSKEGVRPSRHFYRSADGKKHQCGYYRDRE